MRKDRLAALLLCILALTTSWAQSVPRARKTSGSIPSAERSLNSDERLAVLASALDSKVPRRKERDCSHLVHAIYERAGFPYTYASPTICMTAWMDSSAVRNLRPAIWLCGTDTSELSSAHPATSSIASSMRVPESTTTATAIGPAAANPAFTAI